MQFIPSPYIPFKGNNSALLTHWCDRSYCSSQQTIILYRAKVRAKLSRTHKMENCEIFNELSFKFLRTATTQPTTPLDKRQRIFHSHLCIRCSRTWQQQQLHSISHRGESSEQTLQSITLLTNAALVVMLVVMLVALHKWFRINSDAYARDSKVFFSRLRIYSLPNAPTTRTRHLPRRVSLWIAEDGKIWNFHVSRARGCCGRIQWYTFPFIRCKRLQFYGQFTSTTTT